MANIGPDGQLVDSSGRPVTYKTPSIATGPTLGPDGQPIDISGRPVTYGPNTYAPPAAPTGPTAAGKQAAFADAATSTAIGELNKPTIDSSAGMSVTDAKSNLDSAKSAYDQAVAVLNAAQTNVDTTEARSGRAHFGDGTAQTSAQTAAITDAQAKVDAALAVMKKAQDAYSNAISTQGLTATTPATAPSVQATQINSTDNGFASSLVAPTINTAGIPQVSGSQISGAQIDPGNIPSVTAGSASGFGVEAPAPVKVDAITAPNDIGLDGTQGRNLQTQAASGFADTIAGKSLSPADIQMKEAIDRDVGSAYGLAASLQGRNPGEALRAGAINAGDAIAKNASGFAALRAQETQDAIKNLSALSTSIAGEDLQAFASNQTKDLATKTANLQAQLESAKATAANQLAAGQSTAANETNASIATLQAQLDASKANAANSLAVDIANQTSTNDASKANQANALAAETSNAQNVLAALQANLTAAVQTNNQKDINNLNAAIENARNKLSAAQSNQTALLEASKANAGNAVTQNDYAAGLIQQMDQFNAANAVQIQNLNATNKLTEQKIEDDYRTGLLKIASDTNLSAAEIAVQQRQLQQQYDAAQDAFWSGIIGGVVKIGAGIATGGLSNLATSGTQTGSNGSPILD